MPGKGEHSIADSLDAPSGKVRASRRAVIGSAILLGCLWVVWRVPVEDGRELQLAIVASYCLAWQVALVLWPQQHGEVVSAFVLVSISLGSILLLVEGLGWLGIVDYGVLRPAPTALWERKENRFDPELRFTRIPHSRLTGVSRGVLAHHWCLDAPGYPYDVRYDGSGFRNASDLTTADILFIGDSFIEGAILPASQIVTTRLEALTGLSVANVALAGYGPGEELAALERMGPALGPDVVLWAFYEGNDPENLWKYKNWVERGRPPPQPSGTTLVSAIWSRLLDRTCEPKHWIADLQFGKFRSHDSEVKIYFGSRPRSDLSDATLDEIQDVLSRAFEASRAVGADLLVLFVPVKFRVYRDLLELPEESRLRHWHVDDLPQRFERLLRRSSPEIGFIDLTHALAREARLGRRVYLEDDVHWSPEGHAVVARAVARWLKARTLDAEN